MSSDFGLNRSWFFCIVFLKRRCEVQPSAPLTEMVGMKPPRRPGAFQITPARGRSSGAPKNACVFWGRPNLVEPAWPSQGLRARSAFCAKGRFRSGGVDIRWCFLCVKTLSAKSARLARARSRGTAAGRRWRASTRLLSDGRLALV